MSTVDASEGLGSGRREDSKDACNDQVVELNAGEVKPFVESSWITNYACDNIDYHQSHINLFETIDVIKGAANES